MSYVHLDKYVNVQTVLVLHKFLNNIQVNIQPQTYIQQISGSQQFWPYV